MDKLITYETAKKAKEVGFNKLCSHYYILDYHNFKHDGILYKRSLPDNCNSNNIFQYYSSINQPHLVDVSTQTSLQTWLREKYLIHVLIKPVIGSKNGYDSYPIIGWDYDIISNNKNNTNSYYMGYPIGEWFTAIVDDIEDGETLEDYNVRIFSTYEDALEMGLKKSLNLINNI